MIRLLIKSKTDYEPPSVTVFVCLSYGAYSKKELSQPLHVCGNITTILSWKMMKIGCMTVILLSNLQIDLFDYGLLLFEMFNKEALTTTKNVHDQLMKVPDTRLQQVILWCIKQDPEERPSMSDLIHELISFNRHYVGEEA